MGLKSKLLWSGDVYEEFICAICLDIAEDPVSTTCSHIFCRTCSQNYDGNKCPTCQQELGGFPFQELSRTLKNIHMTLMIKCPNSPSCTSKIKIKDLDDHLEECVGSETCLGCNQKIAKHVDHAFFEHMQKELIDRLVAKNKFKYIDAKQFVEFTMINELEDQKSWEIIKMEILKVELTKEDRNFDTIRSKINIHLNGLWQVICCSDGVRLHFGLSYEDKNMFYFTHAARYWVVFKPGHRKTYYSTKLPFTL